MALPTVEQCLRPVLALSAKVDITRRSAAATMEDHFNLTAEERDLKIPSGQSKFSNRVQWGMTYLTKSELIERVAPKTYRATERGRQFLIEHPETISIADLREISDWVKKYSGNSRGSENPPSEKPGVTNSGDDTSGLTPKEAIYGAIKEINEDLKNRLMEEILRQDPTFFEKLVLGLLVEMGYGGSRQEAAEHLGRSNDEGIDGCIKQDPLGLDKVVVQAKRYAPDRAINREAIQSFIGAMSGQGVNKGIFITTSYFNANAKEFVQRGSAQKVILIDGDTLLGLMLKYKVGTRVEEKIDIMALDQNYFNEDE